MPEITVYSAFELLSSGLKLIKDLTASADVKAKVSELYEVVLAGQSRALESGLREQRLIDEISSLKEQLRKVETWETEKQRYELHKFRSGHFAYALKENAAANEPAHYICATCYNESKKSFLHETRDQGFRGTTFMCKTNHMHSFVEY